MSRNKREGWYFCKIAGKQYRCGSMHLYIPLQKRKLMGWHDDYE